MNYRRISGMVALLILSATASVHASELLPLAPGNTWTYRDGVTGESFTIQVRTPVFLNQKVYHALNGYTQEQLLVRLDGNGNLVYWDEDKGAEIVLTSFARVRGSWQAPRRECADEGETLEPRGAHSGPAGRWSVVDIRYRIHGCADAGVMAEQFTENVGMVRRVTSTVAGPRTFDLVHARIGNQTISSGYTGAFTITTTPVVRSGMWLVTLRIDHPYESPLKLHFPSTQQYDLRLRDSEGNILWTWSADKLFAQVAHELRVSGGVMAQVSVPFPPAVPEGPHLYTLEAWMTNLSDEPQFSAATTAEVPRLLPPWLIRQ